MRQPDGYDGDYGDYWYCDACGKSDPEVYSFGDGRVLLCSLCVSAGANYYHKARSGQYLYWTNPKYIDPFYRKPISSKLRKKIYERDLYRCRYCGSHKSLVLDHVVPFVRVNEHQEENLVTACEICNQKKRDRTPEEAGMTLQMEGHYA